MPDCWRVECTEYAKAEQYSSRVLFSVELTKTQPARLRRYEISNGQLEVPRYEMNARGLMELGRLANVIFR